MVVVKCSLSVSDAGADSLAAAITQGQRSRDEERPNKRRKISEGRDAVSEDSTVSSSRTPAGYVTLGRLVLNLSFAEPKSDLGLAFDSSEEPPLRLPVLVKTFENIGPPKDAYLLELVTIPARDTVFADTITHPDLVDFSPHFSLARSLVSVDNYRGSPPVACYQSTLYWLRDERSFQLVTDILWKNSLVVPNRLTREARLVLSNYTPHDRAEDLPKAEHQESRKSSQNSWSPRDFYDNVYVPPETPEASADVRCDLVRCKLYPFQNRAVRWLLEREGVELQANGKVAPREQIHREELPDYFREFTAADGRRCFVSHLFKVVTTDLSGWNDAGRYLKGGILAEEMGLGKTVEVITLMCLHRRAMPINGATGSVDGDGLVKSRATLIITPPAILEQWKQEIQNHSPSLSVFHYTGLQRYQQMSDEELVRMVAENDVVLTTYNVLAKEVHHSGDAPKRDLRHEKKFEPRKTPLVQISWWRVCLDEAQMIESGVSNAARVARLIPRENAWAVTGTPIRKDIKDLFGLLLFLHYEPFCSFQDIWIRLWDEFQPAFKSIINKIALRHSKDRIRSELRLPPQKRVIITIPFTAVEEQHYSHLFEKMCEECGLDSSGAPLREDWDPDSPSTIEKMRSWLTRLRQTCLHPEVAGSNRRALGTGNGPLRSVAEVLEVMIDQNETLIRAEERALLMSQIRRGQLLENAARRREALDIWQKALDRATEMVQECREQLRVEREKLRSARGASETDMVSVDTSSDKDDSEETEKNSRVGTCRQRLRAALEIQHICKFFTANAYYQIKTDPNLTAPDSDEYKALQKAEEDAYEAAKQIRKEMLTDISRKAGRYMKIIDEKFKHKSFVKIPKMKPKFPSFGLEGRRLLEKFENYCDAMNQHAEQYNEWRDAMVKLLRQSLIDEEESVELEGNEYETSTKHQDEMYVYMEALRAMFADRHDALTGQQNLLIEHEVKMSMIQAQKGEGPSPQLYLSIMKTRNKIKPRVELGTLRGIISELRSLATSLEWQESGGSSRARAELVIVNEVLAHASKMASEQGKAISSLEKEVELFRDTMNHRLEYYRQLQQISDTVAPYDEESVGKPLDEALFAAKLRNEAIIDEKLSGLRSKRRYLIHLRDESGPDDSTRICVICQSSFEIGVLTVCGHKYCKDCLRMWWHQHRTCPTCKKRLKANDFHQITYKPQELVVQEEKSPTKLESDRPSKNSIYSDISSGVLKEIKNIDLDSSFGTKIDTLARHIMWLREHDPGAKSIVFSQYKNFLGVLATAFGRFKIGFSSVDAKGGIERFKNDPAVECFLLHAKAHSSGLNLVNATHVFLCEPLINTAIELQAIARVHRIGQHRPTTVWMYLVSDTVEESIYDISVSRRLAHIVQKEKEKEKEAQSPSPGLHNGTTVENITETAIDSANSLEMQDATLGKLLAGGSTGGELVGKDDLWQCLFGGAQRRKTASTTSTDAEREVGRFLRAEAAEERRREAHNCHNSVPN
ncbi:hypothetical protein VTN77DRAFT_5291 [Rasamsonia byssochlamydoides]|uniref:uncharacterized protein n=1 Tax=Rasamsonia byssochlamydoides TaxID=89139 RepID=UPI003743A06B